MISSTHARLKSEFNNLWLGKVCITGSCHTVMTTSKCSHLRQSTSTYFLDDGIENELDVLYHGTVSFSLLPGNQKKKKKWLSSILYFQQMSQEIKLKEFGWLKKCSAHTHKIMSFVYVALKKKSFFFFFNLMYIFNTACQLSSCLYIVGFLLSPSFDANFQGVFF